MLYDQRGRPHLHVSLEDINQTGMQQRQRLFSITSFNSSWCSQNHYHLHHFIQIFFPPLLLCHIICLLPSHWKSSFIFSNPHLSYTGTLCMYHMKFCMTFKITTIFSQYPSTPAFVCKLSTAWMFSYCLKQTDKQSMNHFCYIKAEGERSSEN